MSTKPILVVKRLVVPTIINDAREHVLKYIKTLDNENILNQLIGKVKDTPIARCNISLSQNKHDKKHVFLIVFGFVYPYYVNYVNDKIEKSEYVLAGIINCETEVSSTDDIVNLSKESLLKPVFSKATQLSHNLTAETTNVPIGFDFSRDFFDKEK